jgi:hypothetical protein
LKQGKSKHPLGVVAHKVGLAYISLFCYCTDKIADENDCEGQRCDKGEKIHNKHEEGSGEG